MARGLIRRRAAARAQQQASGGAGEAADRGAPPPGGDGGGRVSGGLSEGLQIFLAVLLGVTALLTAWAAYRGDLYGGDSLIRFNEAIQLTDQSGQAYNEFNQNLVEDTNTFLQFAIAANRSDPDGKQTAEYIKTLFRDEFVPAVEWWVKDKTGAATPFVANNPDYRSVALAQSEGLDKQAKKKFSEGKKLDDTGDKYGLYTVILAAALFLFGIAGVTSSRNIFWGGTGVGLVLVTFSVINLIGITNGAPPLVS
jgi:hypothetical protein